jgi:hypothetical protein
MSLPPT